MNSYGGFPLRWQQHDLCPALNLKGGCGQGFFSFFISNFKAGKMSNRRKKALQNPWYKKIKIIIIINLVIDCNVLRTCIYAKAKACYCGLTDTLSLWIGQQSWGSALPNQNNTIQHKLVCHSLASRQKLAKLTKWCMKGSNTLWNSMMGAKEKRRHRNRTH